MDGYRLDSEPFVVNPHTHVSLFRGVALARNDLPIVAKRHDFYFIHNPESQKLICQSLNAALAQAKVQHPHACDILEVQLEIDKTNCAVYHILQALERSVGQDIEEKKGFTELEMRKFLLQTSSALAFAHQKVRSKQGIAHRDVKPDNVFRTGDSYKLGDFGSFFTKRDSSITNSTAGDTRYMSPQLREACIRGTEYNAFKADVFALGASFLHMATLASTEAILSSQLLDDAVARQAAALPYSEQLRTLLRAMLTYEERQRPTMQQIYSALSEQPPASSPRLPLPIDTPTDQFAVVFRNQVELYGLQSQQSTLEIDLGWGVSYIQTDKRTLLCIGGHPASTKVYALDLPTLQLVPLLPLKSPRAWAGVAKAAHFAYAFGGFDGSNPLKSCEKFGLHEKHWLPVGKMREGRYRFTPCIFHALIYLPCPRTTLTIETFSPETDVFAPLSVAIPSKLLGCDSVAFIANEELCILTDWKQMGRWKVESEREFRLYPTAKKCCSSQSPLIVGSIVLIANNCTGRVEKWSMESHTFISYLN